MIEFRLRNRLTDQELMQKVGKILTPADFNLTLSGPARVKKPDGQLLCVYLPGVLTSEADAAYPLLTKVRNATQNRGLAAGVRGARQGPKGTIWTARPVYSTLLGAVDPSQPRFPYCRLTAYTARQVDDWLSMRPFFESVAGYLRRQVPDRYWNQMHEAEQTRPEWVIPGTPFTTITVNNSYSTGVHVDKGDLDSGFSCLAVLRRGDYMGGQLVFPEYRVAVDMQDGDLLLMDAHSWHGNTTMICRCGRTLGLPPVSAKQRPEGPCTECGAERISVVHYFRTKMVDCGSPREEDAKYASGRGLQV
jgi:hypothetical protein